MPTLTDTQFASLRRRYRLQKSLRTQIEPEWEEIEHFTGPIKAAGQQGATADATTEKSEDRADVWDFTAIDGREKLSSSMQMGITNPNTRFFFASFRERTLNNDNEARTWLDGESEGVWNDLQDSDFNTEIAKVYHEMTGPGPAFMYIEPLVGDPDPTSLRESYQGVDFTSVPLRSAFFEPDRRGGIRTFWERSVWTASEVISYCEEHSIPVPEDIQEMYAKGSDKKTEIVFCIFPRPTIQKRRAVRYPAAPTLRPWGFVCWREDTGVKLGEEDGYYEMPVLYTGWSRTAGSKWPHGPSSIALPTIKYLNGWLETYQTAGEKAVDPPVLANQKDLIANVDLTPGGLTPTRDINGFKTLESNGKFNIAEAIINDLRNQLRSIYRYDDLQLKESPAMTATEVQVRYELMNRVLGKTLTFIQNDLLSPIILTVLAMRIRLGASQPMPKKVKAAGGLFNIEYQGPLARSQRTDEVAAIERGAAFVAGLAQFYPKARAAFDPVKAIKHVFQRLGIPTEIMPSDSEIEKAVKEITNQEKRAIAADAQAKEAKAGKDAAATPAPSGNGGGGPVEGAQYPPLPPIPPLSPTTGQPAGVM